jgi:GTP-binding protein HflX
LEQVARQREVRRSRRVHKDIPIVSVIGYTNAGKSTLINSLTHSNVESENLMFSTLEPVSRRLRFPEEREVIFTDTVGFIRDLPPELMSAFRATLEELQDATVLLHVVDISDPEMEEQIAAVERILEQLELQDIPKLMVLNKTDRMPEEQVENLCRLHQAMGISAMERPTLKRFLEEMERYLWSSPNNRSALEPKKSKKKKKRGWSPLPEENTP